MRMIGYISSGLMAVACPNDAGVLHYCNSFLSRETMGHPVSVRLDDQVQSTLEQAAKARGVGLSTYLRDIAAAEALRIRKERIRAQSEKVGRYVAESDEAGAFYGDWGTPLAPAEPAKRGKRR